MLYIKDRDFIETTEGMLFCVVGYLHPPYGYTAYLKYVPSVKGKWNRDNSRYSRVMRYYHVSQMENTYDYLREFYPEYLFFCPVRNILISTVPLNKIKNEYVAAKKLKLFLDIKPRDKLHKTLNDFVQFLTKRTTLKVKDFGITGSILTGIYNPVFSDIDLTIHGKDASLKVKELLLSLKNKTDRVTIIDRQNNSEWIHEHAVRFHLKIKDVKLLAQRRWNYGLFDDRYFSLHSIRRSDEIHEKYGDYTYQKKGLVTGTAEIASTEESLFLPSVYSLENLASNTDYDISELVSYEVFYSGIFEEGDKISFHGSVEEVSGKKHRYRVVMGGSGYSKAYVKLM